MSDFRFGVSPVNYPDPEPVRIVFIVSEGKPFEMLTNMATFFKLTYYS